MIPVDALYRLVRSMIDGMNSETLLSFRYEYNLDDQDFATLWRVVAGEGVDRTIGSAYIATPNYYPNHPSPTWVAPLTGGSKMAGS